MNFGTKDVQVSQQKSLGISYGILKLKLMDFTVKTAQSGKKQFTFLVEDDNPVGEDGFDYEGLTWGKRKATNKSGRIDATIYIDTTNAEDIKKFVINFVVALADKLNCRAELAALDEVDFNSLEDYLKAAMKVIGNKYAYFPIKAEEYKYNDKIGINRLFKYWGKDKPLTVFSADSTVVKEGNIFKLTTPEGTEYTWDKSNAYDYKPIATPDADPNTGITTAPTNAINDPLPF